MEADDLRLGTQVVQLGVAHHECGVDGEPGRNHAQDADRSLTKMALRARPDQ